MDKTEMLHELCEILMRELDDVNNKISRSGGMSAGDLDTVDKLAHALKSVKTTVAMMESDDGYSNRYYGASYARGGQGGGRGGNQGGGSSNRGNSYARGRGRNARRDSMGRYSREGGYSYADGMEDLIDEMRELLPGLAEEKRRKAEELIDELR